MRRWVTGGGGKPEPGPKMEARLVCSPDRQKALSGWGRGGKERREGNGIREGKGLSGRGLVGHCEDPGFYSTGNRFETGDMISKIKILEIKLSNIFILQSSRKFYHTLRNVKTYNLRYLFRYINVSPKCPRMQFPRCAKTRDDVAMSELWEGSTFYPSHAEARLRSPAGEAGEVPAHSPCRRTCVAPNGTRPLRLSMGSTLRA